MGERRHDPFIGAPFMTSAERDQLIWDMRRKGATYAKIGRRVGMTANGVMMACRRLAESPDPRHPRQGRDARG
jgi:hypothetical protein